MDTVALTRLWYQGTQQQWLDALEQYHELVKDDPLEQQLTELDRRDIECMGAEEFYTFLYSKYYVWKYDAPNRLSAVRGYLKKQAAQEELSELGQIHKEIFSHDREDIAGLLKIVQKIRGMGTAGASGLLALLFPEQFGVLDQFIVIALRKVEGLPQHDRLHKMPAMGIRTNDGVLIEQILKEKALDLNVRFHTDLWTPRKIDMVLWALEKTKESWGD